MADTLAVRYRGCSSSRFPELAKDMPVIRIAIDPADIDEHDEVAVFDVATNLGADLSREDAMRAVGYALHRLAHALLSTEGFIVDLHDLEEPIDLRPAPQVPNQPGGAS